MNTFGYKFGGYQTMNHKGLPPAMATAYKNSAFSASSVSSRGPTFTETSTNSRTELIHGNAKY
ncbi:unnamed protein product [Cylicostephanus goldi]|uniref:Uncharacterized protein n=1 Tax=Cylicostephanus goldi TaxID=71465 RepID=A0A3P6TKX8_CYLGO|nr:unnamed protein product [Cylicostephanus goldi]